jgi:ArsR family transcriptional regulator
MSDERGAVANISQRLAVLRQRRVATMKKEGTTMYYRVSNPEIVQAYRLMRELLIEQLKEAQKLTMLTGRSR